MTTRRIDEIVVGKRHRRDLGDLTGLAASASFMRSPSTSAPTVGRSPATRSLQMAGVEGHPRQDRAVQPMIRITDEAIQTMARAVTERPSSKWTLVDGHLCATSDLFFNDGNEGPCALLLNDGWWFFEGEDARRRDERLHATGSSPQPEREFENALFKQITAAGHLARRQVRTRSGIIDLLIEGDPPTLIEVKAFGDFFTIARAAAQLRIYAREYPGARLAVATPPPVAPEAEAFLKRLGMVLWN